MTIKSVLHSLIGMFIVTMVFGLYFFGETQNPPFLFTFFLGILVGALTIQMFVSIIWDRKPKQDTEE